MDLGRTALAMAMKKHKDRAVALSRCKWYQGVLDGSFGNGELTFRSKHVAFTDCHTPVLEFGNFYQDDDPIRLANCVPFDLTLAVQVEGDPRFIDVTWDGGKAKQTFEPGARYRTDSIGIELTKGQSMIVSMYFQGTKYPHGLVSQIANGEGVRAGNLLKSTTFAPTKQAIFSPLAIYATPSDQRFEAIACFGDSISQGAGFGDEPYGSYPLGDLGFMQLAAMESGRGYVALGMNGQSMDGFEPFKRLRRMDIANHCDIAIFEYGTNDLALTSKTVDQIKAYYLDNWKAAKIRGMKVYQTTIVPRTTSTDNWATTGNQTPVNERHGFGPTSARSILNDWIRSVPSPHLDGYIEIADLCEPTRDSGYWAANTTDDGVHPNRRVHILMAEAVQAKIN